MPKDTQSTDMTLATLARRQHGLLTLRQATDAGLSRDHVRARLRLGILTGVGKGVYRLSGAPRSWEQAALSACLLAGEGSVLYGRSAASVWHLDLPRSRRVEVASVQRRGWTVSSDEIVVRRVRALDRRDCTLVGALPVTTVGRTIVDLAGALDVSVLQQVVDDALVRRLIWPARLAATLERLGGPGRRGTTALRAALAPWMLGDAVDSVAEAKFLRSLALGGLPPPVCQHVVLRHDGRPAVLDFAWPEQRLALEMDGFRWHASPRAHARDSARSNAIAALGWTLLHATPTELAEHPGAVLVALRRRLVA